MFWLAFQFSSTLLPHRLLSYSSETYKFHICTEAYHRQWAWRDRGGTLIHCSLLITPELQKSELILIMMTRLSSAQTACVRCRNASLRLPKSQFNWNKYRLAYKQLFWLSNHTNTQTPRLLYSLYALYKHITTHASMHTVIKERISVCTSHMVCTHPELCRIDCIFTAAASFSS